MASPFFSFNVYSALLLVGWAQGVVYAGLLFRRARREASKSDAFAGLILLVGVLYITQWMLGFAGWYDAHDWRSTVMFYLPWNHLLALGPLIWLYFRSVSNQGFKFDNRKAWHFLPWAVSMLPYFAALMYDVFYLRGLRDQGMTYFHQTRGPVQEWINQGAGSSSTILDVMLFAHLLAYLGYTARCYREYRRYLLDHFSNTRGKHLQALRSLLYSLLSGLVLALLINIVSDGYDARFYISDWYHRFSLALLLFVVGIQFMQVKPSRTKNLDFDPDKTFPDKAEASIITEEPHLLSIWQDIENRMEKSQDYLEPDLRLAELAQRLHTTDKVVSSCINGIAGINFNDYINEKRCRHFTGLLHRGLHRDRTLLALALEAGFNSKSTFNRAFRKYYGCSPGQAIQRLEAEKKVSQKMI